MEWGRLYIVASGVLGLTSAELLAWLEQLAGPGVRRLRLMDTDLSTARSGNVVTRTVVVPQNELSPSLRPFIVPGAPDPLPVGLRIGPWMRQTGTTTQVLDDGTAVEVPVFERVGTLIDLLLPARHVRVSDLEAALLNALAPDQVTRSDGSSVTAAASPVGLKLVPASEVLSPAVVVPAWQPPEVVTDPVVLPGE